MTKSYIFRTMAAFFFIMVAVTNTNAQIGTRVTVNSSGSFCSVDSVSSVIGTGNTAIGRNSFAGGLNSYAWGAQSFAFGTNDTVTGGSAVALGWNNKAIGPYSFTQGYQNTAIGNGSVTMGIMNQAYGWAGVALGYSNGAHGVATISLGSNVYTSCDYGITIGSGISGTYPFRNSDKSIYMGVNAMLPTLTITESPNDGKDYFDRTGKVAIGATNPQSKLHIHSDWGEDAGIILEADNKNNDSAFIRFQDAYRYISVGTDNKMRINAGSNDLHLLANHYCLNSESTYLENDGDRELLITSPNTTHLVSANINMSADDHIDMESNMIVEQALDSLILIGDRLINMSSNFIHLSGTIGVNTNYVPTDFKLGVDGGIIASRVYVKDSGEWPDYVFTDDYKLMSFAELKTYITENGHLPGIPSANEVQGTGIDLGEMQNLLLQKIEELTLYSLKQQETIEYLEKKIDELEKK